MDERIWMASTRKLARRIRQSATSVPVGLTPGGLPIGIQIVGPQHEDVLVLESSAAFECVSPWERQLESLNQ